MSSSSQQPPSRWRSGLKTANDKLWKGLDAVGARVNNLSGKVGAEGFWPQPLALEIEKCSRILRTFTTNQVLETASPEDTSKRQRVLVHIPTKLLRNAQGLAIFTVFRTGLGLSAASGSGVVIARNPDGSWGSPSGILVHTIGFGFLAGADIYDVVLILRNRKAVDVFGNPKVSIGAELSVAAGPIGGGAMVDTGIEAAPVLSYVKSKGLYGGVQLDGNIIIERSDENARFYNRKIKAKEILAGDISRPTDADLLVATIESAEGRHIEPTRPPPAISSSSQLQDESKDADEDDQDEIILSSAPSTVSAPPPIPPRRSRESAAPASPTPPPYTSP